MNSDTKAKYKSTVRQLRDICPPPPKVNIYKPRPKVKFDDIELRIMKLRRYNWTMETGEWHNMVVVLAQHKLWLNMRQVELFIPSVFHQILERTPQRSLLRLYQLHELKLPSAEFVEATKIAQLLSLMYKVLDDPRHKAHIKQAFTVLTAWIGIGNASVKKRLACMRLKEEA